MSRRREEQASSLDLLLGPMCNTFGGILFIAILLVILSHAAGSAVVDEKQRADRARRELQVTEQNAELVRLQQEALNLSRILQQHPPTTTNALPPVIPFVALQGMQASNAVILTDVEQQRLNLMQLRQEADQLKKAMENRFATKTDLERQLAQLDKQVQTASKKEVRTLRLPRLHTIRKHTVFMALKGGRLYPVTDISRANEWHRGYDTTHVTVESGPHHETISLRPALGQHIESGAERDGIFQQMLANVDAKSEYISFMVEPDSYAEFNYVKNIAIKAGFEYMWSPSEGSIRIIKVESVDAL